MSTTESTPEQQRVNPQPSKPDCDPQPWMNAAHEILGDGVAFNYAGVAIATIIAKHVSPHLAALVADRDALDWLEANKEKIFCLSWDRRDSWSLCGEPIDSFSGGIPLGDGPTVRACLDAARAAQGGTLQEVAALEAEFGVYPKSTLSAEEVLRRAKSKP